MRRRQWIEAAAWLWLANSTQHPSFAQTQVLLEAPPFTLGVASGAPTTDSIILWTRLMAPTPFGAPWREQAVTVRWQVAEDAQFARIVREGQTMALPELAHSVHVEVDKLPAGRPWFYRFEAGGHTSPSGRTHTLPEADQAIEQMTFALASCQRYHSGHFGAYRAMLEDQPELVVFLGDYIYEMGAYPNEVRGPGMRPAQTLRDYRELYELAKQDPALQAMHAACPWLILWDDHEVLNDYAGGPLRGASRWGDTARRMAAYQAWYEHMPVRLSALTDGVAGLLQKGAELRIYDRVRYGQLAQFHLLDTRQYREAPLSCGIKGAFKADSCDSWMQPRSMLGSAQEQWLTQGLQQAAAPGMPRWNLLTQSVVFSTRILPVLGGRLYADGWDGYPKARQAILDTWQQHRPPGTVILSGDAHEFWAAHVQANPSDANSPVLPEFVCAGITSRAFGNLTVEEYMALNPHLLAGERRYRGYTLVKLTAEGMQVDWRAIDSVTTPQPQVHTAGRFAVRHSAGTIERLR